ncbi:MAG: hypothetical protein ACJ71P_11865 [Nitrososphaeraceae archaeon]
MSKTVFMTVITIAALLSLSVFATRYASSSSNDNNSNKKPSGDQGARDAINNAPNSNDAQVAATVMDSITTTTIKSKS